MAQGSMLKEVQKIAKQLKAKNPGLKHTEAVALAWKELKKNKK